MNQVTAFTPSTFLPIKFRKRNHCIARRRCQKMTATLPKADIPDHAIGLQSVREVRNPVSLPVRGKIPSYLSESTLYRVGPGRFEVNHSDNSPHRLTHWCDGFSLLHAFHINAQTNSVKYRSRFLCDSMVRSIESTPIDKWADFAFGPADPCRSLLGRFFALWTKQPVDPLTGRPPIPNVGVTVQPIPGKGLTVRTDANYNLALNEENLEIDHFFNFSDVHKSLGGKMSAAHGHFDPNTGEFFNFVYTLCAPGPVKYSVFKVKADGSTQILAEFWDLPCYIHSFAVTENYLVLMLWPLRLNSLRILWSRSIVDGCAFHPNVDCKFLVIPRKGGGVKATYKSPSFCCFHVINAFERQDEICIDLCKYEDESMLHELDLANMRQAEKFETPTISRFTLPQLSSNMRRRGMGSARAIESFVSQCGIELPNFNSAYAQKEYRYAYGVSFEKRAFDVIAKVDVSTGEYKTWTMNRGVVGEPIFVADPDGKREDDGCVLVVVLDAAIGKSCLVVLDAKSMSMIARADVPQVVPLGFHGMIREKGVDYVKPSPSPRAERRTAPCF